MPNSWVTHVKQYAAANKMTYGCAMSDSSCKAAYKKEPTKKSKKEKEEPKTKESKEIKDTKVHTMYKKPIGPVKPVVTQVPKNIKPKYVLEFDKKSSRTVDIIENDGNRNEKRRLMKSLMNSSKKDMKALKWYDENVYNTKKTEPIQLTKEQLEYRDLLNSGKFRKKKAPLP